MHRVPISTRIAVLTGASLLVLLALVGVVVHHQLGVRVRAGIDQQLVDLAAALPPDLARAGSGRLQQEEDAFGDLELSDRLIQVVDGRGRVVAASEDVDTAGALLGPGDLDRARQDGALLRTVAGSGDDEDALRVLAVPYGEEGSTALVAAELEEVEDAQAALVAVYVPVALLGSVVAALLGRAIARRGLAPVRRMTDEAEAISGTDLSRRLSPPPRLDEVGRLTRTLNGMLARLEAAVGRERAFAADAGHELRTPLAILSAEVELARDRVGDGAARSSLDTALAEAGRLSALVDDLLVLARADAGHLRGHHPLDLDELVQVVLARFAGLAARRGVRLTCTGAAVVRGDPSALERAVANLVDNALRHTPGGGTVTVQVRPSGPARADVVVSDTGPGVPPEQLPGLFDRFSRLDDARHEPGGAGLGLAIVAAVATAHSGTATATNQPGGGLRVVLSIAA